MLHMGFIKAKEGAQVKLLVSTKGEHAEKVAFEAADVDPPQLEVTVGEPKKVKDGVTHTEVMVAVPPGTPPMIRLDTAQGEAGKVVLKCNHPLTPEIVLHVRFAVER